MEVILLEKVRKLGNLGDRISVKSGYGRNYLIPKGIAVMASKSNVEMFEARRAELEAKEAETVAQAQTRAAKIADLGLVTITMRASEEGKLFGSVGAADVAAAATEAGVEIAKAEIQMPAEHIRMIGEYEATVHLHSDVEEVLKVVIAAE
jgi:large subunit ribosomal protein L9